MKSKTLLGVSASLAVSAFATASLLPAVSMAQEQSRTTPTVQFIDVQTYTMNDTRIIAASASRNKIAIVVWGGNRVIQQEAYNAARDLVNIGIPTAFVLGPDDNGLDADAAMTIYAASLPRFDSRWGTNYASSIRADMREGGVEAYRMAFPREAAALGLPR